MSNIYLFTSSFPFSKGETFLETEVLYLAKHFENVWIVPYQYGASKLLRQMPENVIVKKPLRDGSVKTSVILLRGIFNFHPLLPFIKDLHNIKSIKHFKRWIRETIITRWLLTHYEIKNIISDKRNCITYFYWGSGPTSSNLSILLNKRGKNVIVRFHGGDLYKELPENEHYIPFRTIQLKNISCAVPISAYGELYLQKNYPNINFKSDVHRLGTHYVGIAEPSTDNILRIVSCSNIIPIKRVEIIAQTLNKVTVPFEWVHFGDGICREKVEEIISDHIKPFCTFKGHTQLADILAYYKSHPVDLFINVSSSEGVPVSVMEAISFGVPIIATDVGGTAELVDNSLGYLLPKDITPHMLQNVIENYYNLPKEEKDLLRQNAFIKWQHMADAEKNYTEFCNFLESYNV